MIYNRASETMPREDIEQLQIERLQMTLNRVYRNVAFYSEAFDAHGVNIEMVKSLRDLRELPFTTKEDLVRSYPYGMFAVPLRDIVRIHSSSGTTGQPIVMGYTVNDIRNWSELVARLLTGGGVTNHDLVQISLNYSLFTGGFGYHYGAEKIGASVIPASVTGDIEKQIMIMKDYKTTALVSTPSYALIIAKAMSEMNIHPDDLVPEERPLLRGAVERGRSGQDRREAPHRRHRQLRAFRDHGARGLRRVPGEERPPCKRGPFHRGDHRSEDPESRSAPASRASSSSPPSPRKGSRSSGTAPATWPPCWRATAPAGARSSG